MPRLKNMKKTETSTEQNSLYWCLFAALFERNQGGNRRCCRFIGFSSNFDNVWFHTLLFLCAAKITKLWESFLTILNQPRQHWKIEMMLWGFAEELNKLWREERLKDLPGIPELWRELNQKTTLDWETSVILPSQVSLKHQLLKCLCQDWHSSAT